MKERPQPTQEQMMKKELPRRETDYPHRHPSHVKNEQAEKISKEKLKEI